jgi:amino acid transporter
MATTLAIVISVSIGLFVAFFLCFFSLITARASQKEERERRIAEHRMNARLLRLNL